MSKVTIGGGSRSLAIETPTVAFPGRTLHYTFEQVDPNSPLLKKLLAAKSSGETIVLLAQKQEDQKPEIDPASLSMDELRWQQCQAELLSREVWQNKAAYNAGVVANVKACVLRGSTLKLTFETTGRVAVKRLEDKGGWQEVVTDPWPYDNGDEKHSEPLALADLARRDAIELVKARYPAQFTLSAAFENKASEMTAVKMVRELSALDSPSALSDYLIETLFANNPERQILHAPEGHRQELLERNSLEGRLSKLLEIVAFSKKMAESFNKLTAEIAMNEALATQKEEFLRTFGHMLSIGRQNNYMLDIKRLFGDMAGPGEETAQMSSDLTKLKALLDAKNLPPVMKQEVADVIQQITEAPFSPETPMLKNFLKWVAKVPWGANDHSPVKSSLTDLIQTLDDNHYGQKQVKDAVVLYLARKLHAKAHAAQAKGKIMCLVGPPGVGKTRIAEVIAEALGLEFVRMAIGGVKDEAALRGFMRTYTGAQPGTPVKLMAKAGKTNPLFLLDEIDKGDEPIQSAALELLDPNQNHGFNDRYLENYDFSQTFFVATANDWDKISPALKDRMEYIYVPSYLAMEKLEIAKRHLIPKTMKATGLENLAWNDDAILEMIERYTWEAGVRDLGRNISKVCDTICKERILADEAAAKNPDAVKSPPTTQVTTEFVKTCLGKPTNSFKLSKQEDKVGVVTGLVVYRGAGGDLGFFKATKHKRTGEAFDITFTGNFKDIMKESVKVVSRFIEDNATRLGIPEEAIKGHSAHVHAENISMPKDGPSAGLTMTAAVVSALTGVPIQKDVAMTGEIDISGDAHPIGGVREKLVAAARAGIKKVLIPRLNYEQDWDDIPDSLKNDLNFQIVPDDTIFDVLEHALVKKAQPANDHKFALSSLSSTAPGSICEPVSP
jgi:ATP-dependent Lon protease